MAWHGEELESTRAFFRDSKGVWNQPALNTNWGNLRYLWLLTRERMGEHEGIVSSQQMCLEPTYVKHQLGQFAVLLSPHKGKYWRA